MKNSIVIIGTACLLLTITVCFGETVELRPVEAATLHGQTDGASDARILLRFDVSSIPSDARIEYAGLRLTNREGPPWDLPFLPVMIGALISDWDASDVSWVGPSENEEWANPGGDWDSRHTAYRVIVRKARAPAKFMMTHVVSGWLNGELTNYGVVAMLLDPDDLSEAVQYFSAEMLNPLLKIDYSQPSEFSDGDY